MYKAAYLYVQGENVINQLFNNICLLVPRLQIGTPGLKKLEMTLKLDVSDS